VEYAHDVNIQWRLRAASHEDRPASNLTLLSTVHRLPSTGYFFLLPPFALSGYHQQTFRAVMVTAGQRIDMSDVSHRAGAGPESPGVEGGPEPRFRPRDQFWPYADLEEEPSDEELAKLDPDLQAALLEVPPDRPFSCTLVFAPFDGPDYPAAVALAKSSADYLETGKGTEVRHRARFTPDRIAALRDLWQLVGRIESSEVLIDDRPVPYARELWLPLLWYLLPR